MYELPEDGTDVTSHVVIVKDYMDVFVIFAFVGFYNK